MFADKVGEIAGAFGAQYDWSVCEEQLSTVSGIGNGNDIRVEFCLDSIPDRLPTNLITPVFSN